MHGRNGLLALFVVLQFSLLGCLGNATHGVAKQVDDTIGFASNWYELALPNAEGHDHKDLSMHLGLTTPNFEVVGWNPLITDRHEMAGGGYFCGDVGKPKEGRRLAVVHSWVSDVGFMVLDVTDPLKVEKLSEMLLENSHVYDLAITPDQHYALLGTTTDQMGIGPDTSPVGGLAPTMRSTDACTGEERVSAGPETAVPFVGGVVLVDISNPRSPQIADYRPFPVTGSHSIVSAELDGRTLGVSTVENPVGEASYYAFFEVLTTPLGGKLNVLSVYTRAELNQQESSRLFMNNHDVILQKHPVTGKNLAYLADGNNGLLVLDVTDLQRPVRIAHWADWDLVGGFHSSHYIHSVMPIEGTWEGRHYLFMSEECPSGRPPKTPSCLVYAMDTTDPTSPTLAGAWTFPFDAGNWVYPGFSMHYMAIVNRTLFVSAFHAGVWALDVSSAEKIHDLNTVGVFVPDYAPPAGFLKDHTYHRSPETGDVVALGDGNIITFEETSGAYVVHFDADRPAPLPPRWPIPGTFYGNE